MSGNLQVSMLLKAVDQASSVLKQVSQNANALAERAARTAKDGQNQTQRAYRETSQVFNRSVTDQTRLAERAAQTREQSSSRAENAIQREVAQTEAAYRRVNQASTASATAQQRAFAGVSAQARRTTTDLQTMARQQEQVARQTRQGGGASVVGAVAGITAAGMVLQRPMMDQRDYDLRLRYVANTTFDDRKTVAGREQGVGELDAAS